MSNANKYPVAPVALGSSFGAMANVLAKKLISLGESLQRGCQLQEGWVAFIETNTLQSAVVLVVAIGVRKSSGCLILKTLEGGSITMAGWT